MTLHVYADLEQRSPEWYEARCGLVTASAVGRLITTKTLRPAENDESRGLTALLVAERVTGYVEPTYVNSDMWRGIEEEPRARDKYAEHKGVTVAEVGFMVLDEPWGKLGFSPDGLVGTDGLLEVKAPRAKTHLQTILSGEVPAYHMPQLQAGLLVSGRQWVDFVSWCGGLPMWVKRVHPGPRWFDAIRAAVEKFERDAEQMVADYHAATEGLPMTERIEGLELKLA